MVTPERYVPAASPMTLRDLWRAIRRSTRLILAITAAVVGITALVTFVMAPRYESDAILRIETKDAESELLSKLEPITDLGLPSLGKNEVDTEIGVLQSRRIAMAVMDSLSLHVELRWPRMPRDSVLEVLRAPRDAVPAQYVLRYAGGGSYRVDVDDAREPTHAPERITIGQTATLGGVSIRLLPALRADPPSRIALRVRPYRRALEKFQDKLEVDKEESGSQLVEIAYRSPDRIMSARVVNAVANSYIAYKDRTSSSDSRRTVAVLRQQVASYQDSLRESERRLRAFRERADLVNAEAQSEAEIERLGELRTKHDALLVERSALSELLREVDSAPPSADGPSPYRRLVTSPSFVGNVAVQSIAQNLTRLEDQRAQLLTRRTPTNADVRAVDDRISELESQLHRMATNYLGSLETELAATDAALARFDRELSTVPAKETELERQLREQKLLSEIYTALQTRLKEAEVKAAIDPGRVRIVDAAMVAYKPAQPKPAVNLILGTVLGLMLGLAVAVGREMADTTVRTPLEVELLTGGIPVLGTIPAVRRVTAANGSAGGRLPLLGGTGIPPSERVVTRLNPFAPAADAYRVLRDNLVLTDGAVGAGVVVVTSAQPGDGTSTVAANLAVTAAQHGSPTLLIDADLRGGVLHELFGVPRAAGLLDVLTGSASLQECIRSVDAEPNGGGLFLLPAGSPPVHPAQLRSPGGDMRGNLAELRRRYSSIIIDTPPLDRDADALFLGSLADETLVVARSGVTDRDLLIEAIGRLRRANVRIGGLVLNGLDAQRARGSTAEVDGARTNGRGH
jgi:tyrosine-protein kinase Etk/Wzc